jgi:hypothetical protein
LRRKKKTPSWCPRPDAAQLRFQFRAKPKRRIVGATTITAWCKQGPKRQDWLAAAWGDDSRSRWGFARRAFAEASGGRARWFHSFAIGGLALRQKGLRAPGIVMDRLPTPDIDSTCSKESSLRTAWISRRDRRPKTRAGERADNKTWA